MKNLLVLIFFSFFEINGFTQKTVSSLPIIMLQIGEKNPSFNEGKYSNLKFYYTPKLNFYHDSTINKQYLSGEPKILEEWFEKQDLQYHAILFDKNGIGAWEGTLMPDSNILFSKGFNNINFLQAINKYVIEKETIIQTNHDLKFYSNNSVYRGKYFQCPFVEQKMVSFYVYDKFYNSLLINNIINQKKPALLIFYYYNTSAKANKKNTFQLFKILNELITL